MNWVVALFAAVAAAMTAIAYRRSPDLATGGWKIGLDLLWKCLPMLVLAFAISGLVQAMVPRENIVRWLGKESGWRGIWIGTLIGALTPGGPYTSFPIVGALHQAGAGLGTLVAFVTSWSLWAIARIPIEIAVVSPKFFVFRFLSTVLFPPLAGAIAHYCFSKYFN